MSQNTEQPTGQVIATVVPAELRHRTGDSGWDTFLRELGEAALHQWGWQAEVIEFPGGDRDEH